jgi:hypothetical protein
MRQLRSNIISQLSGVANIAQIPLGLGSQIRDEVANLLRDPRTYAYQGACGGYQPDQQPSYAQETQIGHYEE